MNKLQVILLLLFFTIVVFGQTKKDKEIITEDQEAKQAFLETDQGMDKLFGSCYGYVIFPNVVKAV